MKRSEAINRIARLIGDKGSGDYNFGEEIAPEIVDLMEKLGMLPPTIKNPKIPQDMDCWKHATEKALDELYDRTNPIGPFEVNEWESE